MKVQTLAVAAMFFALAGLFVHTEATTRCAAIIHSGAPNLNSNPPPSSGSPQTPREQEALHRKCVEAGERLERDAAAMVPGRTWTWQLDSERSREHLDDLRRDLKAFRDADVAFEESLSPEQRSKFNSHIIATRELFQRLEGDTQSLDHELRKGYPTRWHVANDVSDMQREIHHWRKLHRRIAVALGVNP